MTAATSICRTPQNCAKSSACSAINTARNVSRRSRACSTTCANQRRYPHAEFKEVYHWRWNEETYFGRIKNIFEVERFSGFSEVAIKQDFFGVIFLATLESILAKSAQADLSARDIKRQTKTRARVNRAISYLALVDRA